MNTQGGQFEKDDLPKVLDLLNRFTLTLDESQERELIRVSNRGEVFSEETREAVRKCLEVITSHRILKETIWKLMTEGGSR